jgi:hypothetical protein
MENPMDAPNHWPNAYDQTSAPSSPRSLRALVETFKTSLGAGMGPFEHAYRDALHEGKTQPEAQQAGVYAVLNTFVATVEALDESCVPLTLPHSATSRHDTA